MNIYNKDNLVNSDISTDIQKFLSDTIEEIRIDKALHTLNSIDNPFDIPMKFSYDDRFIVCSTNYGEIKFPLCIKNWQEHFVYLCGVFISDSILFSFNPLRYLRYSDYDIVTDNFRFCIKIRISRRDYIQVLPNSNLILALDYNIKRPMTAIADIIESVASNVDNILKRVFRDLLYKESAGSFKGFILEPDKFLFKNIDYILYNDTKYDVVLAHGKICYIDTLSGMDKSLLPLIKHRYRILSSITNN